MQYALLLCPLEDWRIDIRNSISSLLFDILHFERFDPIQ